MSTSVTPALQCPRCTATLRAGAEWCSLCYADLRPAPEPVAAHATPVGSTAATSAGAAPDLDPVPSVPVVGADIAPFGGGDAKPRGKRRKSGPSEDEVEALAAQLVAQLAVTESGRPLGAASGLVDSTGKRAAVMIGGGLAAMLLIFLLMLLVGALL